MTSFEIKKAKRLEDFSAWINLFSKEYEQSCKIRPEFVLNAAGILNDTYWTLIENYVRPLVLNKEEQESDIEGNISRYKIISASELVVILVQPVVHENPENERKLNALFAYFIAMNILQAFNKDINKETFKFVDNYKEEIPGVNSNFLQTIHDDHLVWLELLDPQLSLPILSNAQTWRLFNLCLLCLEGKVKL